MRPLLAIDGDSYAHRAYHGLPKSIARGDGRPAGAIVGFANALVRLWQAERPRAIVTCWDTLGVPTYRNAALAGYQGGREFDDAIVEQLGEIRVWLESTGIAVARDEGYEADDFLAAAARAEEEAGGVALVATSDRDAFQLASARTTILQPAPGGTTARIGPAEVLERYGVEPAQVPDFIALRGDPSDRIPGARGIGAKKAAALLREHGTLEAAIGAGRFPDQAEELRLYRRIATLDASAPLPSLADHTPRWAEASTLSRAWGLNGLADRLAALVA